MPLVNHVAAYMRQGGESGDHLGSTFSDVLVKNRSARA